MKLHVYRCATPARADILLCHGVAEHHRRYFHVIKWLNQAGFDVFAYDHAGHGETLVDRAGQPIAKGVVDVGTLIEDHRAVRRTVSGLSRTGQLFLLGHSMGGLVTAVSALDFPQGVAGVILSGPAVISDIPKVLVGPALRLAKHFPSMRTVLLDANEVASDPTVVDEYLHDPLNYVGPVPLLTAATLTKWAHYAHENVDRWSLPVLIMHGAEDKIVSPAGSAALFAAAQANGVDASLILVDGEKHEIFNGFQAGELISTVVEWVGQRLS